jgi:N-acetylated-alpha-linked acidic dipeptidase
VIPVGDPLSDGWASVANAYRAPLEDVASLLPRIPAQPLGYGDARVLMEKLGGPPPPSDDWVGGMDGVEYRIGGEFLPEYSDWVVRLTTHNFLKDVHSDASVIGIIRGQVEPDRYVIVGNHRDAWGFGSVDPSSGTSNLLELARVFGQQLQTGWRPRRSLVFASWAVEEFGTVGSTEWVHHKVNTRGN